MPQEFQAGAAFQMQRDTEIGLEIGCVVDALESERWRQDAAIIAEALARLLDDIRGTDDLGEYASDGYAFSLTGWSPPGAQDAEWGGFVMRARIIKSDQLT